MTRIERHLRLFETTVLAKLGTRSQPEEHTFSVSNGSRIVFSLHIKAISPGCSVVMTVNNGFTFDLPFDEVLSITGTAQGIFKKVLTDFHNLFTIRLEVTGGGEAEYALGVTVNDNALSTRIENAEISVDLDHVEGDSVRVGDGIEEMAVNPDGSINVSFTDSNASGEIKSVFNEQPSVASGVETVVASYTVPVGKAARLQRVDYSGENIALYRVTVNAIARAAKRTHHGSGLSGQFVFVGGSKEGLPLVAGDVVQLRVLHERPSSGSFEGRIQAVETG